ncbi:hypothetical protein pb186bvf_016668 [Paramecium bursaria]
MDQQPDKNLLDQLEEALSNEKKLNLTADKINPNDDEDEQEDDKDDDIEATQKLEGLMQNLLQGLGGDNEQTKQFQNLLGQFKDPQNGEQNFDEMADKMLLQFMNKDLLYEPLKESKENYAKVLANQELPQPQRQLYEKQAKCVDALLNQLELDPDNKQKLVQLFEEMQAAGDPPKEIFQGENPFSMLQDNECKLF